MGCVACGHTPKAPIGMKLTVEKDGEYPLNASDLMVYINGEVERFQPEHWSNSGHKLLIFIPKTFTPVCQSELGALNNWVEEFHKLGCNVYAVTTDNAYQVKEWFETEESLANPNYSVLSSYLLAGKLGVLQNGRARRSSVFIMEDGEVVVQNHFEKVGRSLAELHRMLYGYVQDSYCAEGWSSPEDGFLELKAKNGD